MHLQKSLQSKNKSLILTAHTKFRQNYVNKIEPPHEFIGKNLHYVNSANSSFKTEVKLIMGNDVKNWIFLFIFQPIQSCSKKDIS